MPIPADEVALLATLANVKYAMEDILAAIEFDQLIPLPPLPNDPATRAACAEVYEQFVAHGDNVIIPDEALHVSKWVFLEYVVKQYGMLVHGSADPDIACFEPRVSQDTLVGGDQPRVYAASSGMLAGFFAVVDRQRLNELPVIPAINNIYVSKANEHGQLQEAFHFAVDHRALAYAPWHAGTVYILPGDGFTADHQNEQWWSIEAVTPRARLTLRPHEWPLLNDVRGVDFIALLQRSQQHLAGMPWWGDEHIYPRNT